jgi:dephospho-CoA kinase
MLRVGLTGDLGSGKSTVAAMLAARGAVVLSSDEMARAMMQPGEAVYEQIVEQFGSSVVASDGKLDRRKLAELAFDPKSLRVAELNAIVHPAVIAAQAKMIAGLAGTKKIVVVESALIFDAVTHDKQLWRTRFDRILLVFASKEKKIARFVERVLAGGASSQQERTTLEAEARRRLALQHTEEHAAECMVIRNNDGPAELESQVDVVWSELERLAGMSDHP